MGFLRTAWPVVRWGVTTAIALDGAAQFGWSVATRGSHGYWTATALGALLLLLGGQFVELFRLRRAEAPTDPSDRQVRNLLAEECEREAEALFLFAGHDHLGNPPAMGGPQALQMILGQLAAHPSDFDRERGPAVRSLARRLEAQHVLTAEDRELLLRRDASVAIGRRLRELAGRLWA